MRLRGEAQNGSAGNMMQKEETIMAKYMKNGNNVRVIPDGQVDIRDRLPAGLYAVNLSINGFYLTKTDSFKLPERIFGDVIKFADRIIKTFGDREKSTGVLLSGLKGSGKTLLLKFVATELQKHGFPVILVNDSYNPSGLAEFISSINEECAVLFDEFEKNYKIDEDSDSAQQENLLTLFDGTIETKKLYILTCNDLDDIDDLLLNRPGRMYYHIEHSRLSDETIKEFCDAKLKNKSYVSSIIKIGGMVGDFSFDMLDVLVEEVNRYNISPVEALSILNIKPESCGDHFSISVYRGEELLKEFDDLYYDPFGDRPKYLIFDTKEVKRLKMKGLSIDEDDDDDDRFYLTLVKDKITSVNQDTYTYNVNGYQVVAKKIKDTFDITKLMN
jgi:hypothetical protein